jgi:hypothetical protein
MFNLISTIGWLGFAAGLIYYFVNSDDPTRIQDVVVQTQTILIVAACFVVVGYVVKFVSKKVDHSKCQKCGKKIDKGEMFCFDHRRESIWKAQEDHRLEGSGKFNRTQKRT